MSESVQVDAIPAQWHAWLLTNIARDCSEASMLEAMLGAGIQKPQAQSWLRTVRGASAASPRDNGPAAASGRQADSGPYHYEGSRLQAGNTLQLEDRAAHVSLRLHKPDLAVLDDFLTADECEALIAAAQGKLSPSTTVDPDSGETISIPERSSEGTHFQLGETKLIAAIERRIAAALQWPVENGEGFQVLHYRDGGEYRPHYDYFPPGQAGSARHLSQGGQRIATVLIYLNEVRQGGATIFPRARLSLSPRRGTAIYFGYCNSRGQVDPVTLHGGAPVLAGDKWIATKWLRQRRYGTAC